VRKRSMATMDRCVDRHIKRFLLIFVIHFRSYTKHLSAVCTNQSSKHSNKKHPSSKLRAQLKRSQRCA